MGTNGLWLTGIIGWLPDQKAKHTGTIRCDWFPGNVRAAMDASVLRNEKVHLPIDQGDKHEVAWTRTLLDWDGEGWRSSKQMVVKITGCGEGTVAEMRRVVKVARQLQTGADTKPRWGRGSLLS